MKQITFVTSNDNKLREAEAVLGVTLKRVSLELDELQSMDLRQIVTHKVRQAYERLGSPVIVEDAGLFLDAWQGFPGPFIKWVAETMGHEALIRALPTDNRAARWRVMYAYCNGNDCLVFEGEIAGTIAKEFRSGAGGWGFDPIFIPEGHDRTYAEMGELKLQFSARQRALEKLKNHLSSLV